MTRKRQSDDDGGDGDGDDESLLLLFDDALDAAFEVSGSLSDSGSSASPPPPATMTTPTNDETPTAPRVRKRRRHEVLRLQTAAAALELELSRLVYQQQQVTRGTSLRAVGARAAAKRARRAAARARLENAKLREALTAQADVVRALQEAVAKRRSPTAAHELEAEPEQEMIPYAASTVARAAEVAPPTAKERTLYAELGQSGDARAGNLVAFVRRGGLTEPKSVGWLLQNDSVEVTMTLNEHKCVCIDFIHRYILPFDFRAGAHVIWTQVLSKVCKLMSRSPTHTEVIADTDNVIVTKQSASSNYITDDNQFTTEYAVSKRIAKANSVEFLWDSVVESNGSIFVSSGSEAVGMQLVQEGWGSVAHVSTVSGTSAASVIQAYIRLTPSMVATKLGDSADPDGQPRPHGSLHVCPRFDVSRLSAIVAASYQRNAVAIRRFIENRLIDDMVRGQVAIES